MSGDPTSTTVLREYQLEVALDAANKEIAFLREILLLLAKGKKR